MACPERGPRRNPKSNARTPQERGASAESALHFFLLRPGLTSPLRAVCTARRRARPPSAVALAKADQLSAFPTVTTAAAASAEAVVSQWASK